MDEIPIHIFWCDDIDHLVHIKQNAVTCGHIVVSVMMADKMFDLGKHLLNRIQIGGVGGEVLDPHSCVYKNC